jgi:hypothetical protein
LNCYFQKNEEIRVSRAQRRDTYEHHDNNWISNLDPSFDTVKCGLRERERERERGEMLLSTKRAMAKQIYLYRIFMHLNPIYMMA